MFRWLFRRKHRHTKNTVISNTTNNSYQIQETAAIAGKIKKLNHKYQRFNDEYWTDLKSLLISTDMGAEMALSILSASRRQIEKERGDFKDVKLILKNAIVEQYAKNTQSDVLNYEYNRLNTFLIVGVNGVGKTTTIAKLANFYLQRGQKILLVAADTFRAGAVEQLKIWAERLNVDIVVPKHPKQDPTSVLYQGLEKARDEKYDAVFIDTAGRLQNRVNLMNELGKINRVFNKILQRQPNETLLVLDAIIGQNGLKQAEIFLSTIRVTGIVLTKMDSTARGGVVLKIKDQFNLPVKLIGFGESLESLKPFDVEEYAQEMLGIE